MVKALRTPAISTLATGAAAIMALLVAGCRPDTTAPDDLVTGSLPRPGAEIARQPRTITIAVRPTTYGMTPKQQVDVMRFLEQYRQRGADKAELTISVPSGGSLEPSAIEAASQVRQMIRYLGISDRSVRVDQHRAHGQLAHLELVWHEIVLDLPECGYGDENLARNDRNIPPANAGCAVQRNSAVMVARPADLVGPRAMLPRASERRDEIWEKYVRGKSTVSEKQGAEKLAN